MPSYIAITIGPVFRTIDRARRTRMTWAASYFYSYITKKLAFFLNEEMKPGFHDRLIFPAQSDNTSDDSEQELTVKTGAGLYADKLLFESRTGDMDKVELAIDKLIDHLTIGITKHIDQTKWGSQDKRPVEESKVKEYLRQYLQFYYIEKEYGEKDGSPVLEMYKYLDMLEVRQQHITEGDEDYLFHFLFRVNKEKDKKSSFLAKDAFGDDGKRFDSLVEITTRGLGRISPQEGWQAEALRLGLHSCHVDVGKRSGLRESLYTRLACHYIWYYQKFEDEIPEESYQTSKTPNTKKPLRENNTLKTEEESQNDFLTDLKKIYKADFRQYHKYVAVISADGDNISGLLNQLGASNPNLKAFSKAQSKFSDEAAQAVVVYGGAPIYMGGDDMVIFAPVACRTEDGQSVRTIFDLITEVDRLFDKAMGDLISDFELTLKSPTISWGVAIGYYKHPLIDFITESRRLLDTAKDKSIFPDKNTIGLSLQKHSGQTFEAFYEKTFEAGHRDGRSFARAKRLISDFISLEQQTNSEDIRSALVSGIAHRLKNAEFSQLLDLAATEGILEHFFENTFNEPFHRQESAKKYLEQVRLLVQQAYEDYSGHTTDGSKRACKMVYATLRLLHFLLTKDDEA